MDPLELGNKVLQWIGVVTTLLTVAYSVSLVVPGDEPDSTIKKILEFTQRISRK